MTNKQNAIGVVVGRFQVHKLTEILAGLLLNVLPRNMTINGIMFKNVHWICQKLLRRGVCL